MGDTQVHYQNDRFLQALRLEKTDRPPVWLMRQAGRYLPEYRALRKKAPDFLDFCKNPEWALEATLQPLKRFELDAAILFSDILTIPASWGLGLHFVEQEGPCFAHPIRTPQDVARLPAKENAASAVVNDLPYVYEATALIRRALGRRLPLIGFAGSPWTLACYMINGRGSSDFISAKRFAWECPEAMHDLLGRLTEATIGYLRQQHLQGADALMVFDTWGGLCAHEDYHTYSWPYLKKIVDALKEQAPVIVFTKGGGVWLDSAVQTGAAGVGMDWTVDLPTMAGPYAGRVAFQGNVDPALLYAPAALLQSRVRSLVSRMRTIPGHILNLGHGIQPQVDPDQITRLIEAAHEAAQEVVRSS